MGMDNGRYTSKTVSGSSEVSISTAEAAIPQLFQSIIHAAEISNRLSAVAEAILGRLDGKVENNQNKSPSSESNVGALLEASRLVDSLLLLEEYLSGIAHRIG